MHKIGRFHDTSELVQNVHRFYCALLVKSCYTPQSIQHESEKHGEKHGFGVICASLEKGPRTTMGCSMIQL